MVALIGFFVLTKSGPTTARPASTELRGQKPDAARVRKPMTQQKKVAQKPVAKSRGERPKIENDRPDLSPADKKLLDRIQSALDAENLQDLLKVLPEAMASQNVEIRSDLVDALGWFGKDAMLELLPLMADPDEDVAESAVDNWTMALSEVDDEKEKSTSIVAAMKVLKNEEALEAMVLELDDCKDSTAIHSLINIIESGNKVAAAVAREHYEFMTDEKYSGVEAAQKWLDKNADEEDDK